MKKLIVMVLALMMVFSFAACGSKEEPASTATSTSTATSSTDDGATSDPYADPYADPYKQG